MDYFRLDGSTEMQKRKDTVDRFNDPSNSRARLFLISTKAGGIGINLVGANRCVIFDACWNPSHDTQSIFRIYRFGQVKSVYVYRFLAQGTMEEKIYQRQVTKQSLSQRVIDEHQLDRHFTSQELRELYSFEPDTLDDNRPIPPMPADDDLLKSVIFDCRKWLVKYHEHDSLLENKINEGLSEAERKAAWDEYEREKSMQDTNRTIMNSINAFSGVFQPDVSVLFFKRIKTRGLNNTKKREKW
jgi:transcriptional regulator ATRX